MQSAQEKKKLISHYIHEDEAFWKKHQSDFTNSRLTRTEYCRIQGIDYNRFTYWLTKLFPKIPQRLVNEKPLVSKQPSLLSVQVKPEPKQTGTLCSLTLKNGFTLQIHDQSALSFILDKVM